MFAVTPIETFFADPFFFEIQHVLSFNSFKQRFWFASRILYIKRGFIVPFQKRLCFQKIGYYFLHFRVKASISCFEKTFQASFNLAQ